jgi:hypothetical protein
MTTAPTPAAAENAELGKKSIFHMVMTPIRHLWAGRIDLGRVGMAVALPVLAWVFYTTSSGMIDIMQKEPGDPVGIIGTLVATSAILIMLAATSWSLGADLAALIAHRRMARERMIIKTLVTAIVFAFVFSISAFFSFTYYYNNIFKLSSRKIVAELQPNELAAEVILPAARLIAAARQAEAARIVATPSFRTYLDSLDALILSAREAGPPLRETIRKNQEAQRAVLAQVARQVALDVEAARAAARQITETQQEIVALEKSAAAFDDIIKAKQGEIDQLAATARQEEQLAVDAAHGLDNQGATCGPNCRGHRARAQEALQRLAVIRRTLAGPTSERANALKKRDVLVAALIPLKQKAGMAESFPGQFATKPAAAPDLDDSLRELAALRDQLRVDPTWARVGSARPLCEPILVAARQANAMPAAIARDFACEPQGEARDLLMARDKRLAARAAYDQKCGMEAGLRDELNAIVGAIRKASASDKNAAAEGFTAAKAAVDGCVVAGKAQGLSDEDVQDLLKKSDAFLRAHSSERNKFELAREAFWSFTPDSTMAICVAMAQDAFVFIMKFLSEIFKRGFEARERRQFAAPLDMTDDEDEPVEIRAMKALLRVARPLPGDMSEINPAALTIVALPPAVRDNLTAILNRLVRDEIAHVERSGAYVVDNVTIAQVEQRLHAALKPRGGRSALRPMLGQALDGGEDGAGPRAFYADPIAARSRRRRPTALERYLTESANAENGAAQG